MLWQPGESFDFPGCFCLKYFMPQKYFTQEQKKAAAKAAQKRFYKKHRKEILADHKKLYAESPEFRQRQKEYYDKWKLKNPEKILGYLKKAKLKRMENRGELNIESILMKIDAHLNRKQK